MKTAGAGPINPFIKDISTSMRILLSGLVLLVGFGVAVFVFVHAFSEDLYAAKRQSLENIVSLAKNSMDPILKDRLNGKITLAQARIRATEAVSRFVYSDNTGVNFLFLTTYDGYLLVEPSAPERVGTYQMQRRDREGVLITQALLQKAMSGGGFVEHYETRASDGTAVKKILYVVGIPEIECYVGTGLTVNDLDDSVRNLLMELLLLGLLLFLLVFGLQYYFLRPFFSCVNVLSESFKKLGENPACLLPLDPTRHIDNSNTKEVVENFTSMLYRLQLHQESIQQNAEIFRQIAHIATDVIWQWEASTGKVKWSENIRDIVVDLPEIYEAHFEVIEAWVHVEDREKRRQLLAAHLSGETESYVCEYRIRSGDGSYRWVQARGVATFDENRTPVRMAGSLLDFSGLMANSLAAAESDAMESVGMIPQTIEKVLLKTPPVPAEVLVVDVKNRLEAEKWQGFVVVENDVPVGLIMKSSLNQLLSGQYGVSLYYSRPVQSVMDPSPLVVDADSSLEIVSTLLQNRPEGNLYDLIVVTRGGKYLGTVSVMDLLTHLTDLRIQLAANANPLTGLAGNRVIDEKFQHAVMQKDPFVALYLDLDNFKAFNDKYGFERGDAVLKLTASILKEAIGGYGEKDAFLGHIGGDDFIILLSEKVSFVSVAERIILKFDAEIRSLYSPEDLAQECIVVPNRKGNREEFPIMSISIAVVDSCCRNFTSHLEIAEIAANLKHRAKAMRGSVWVSDRRVEPCARP